jgi:hypothetical protein
MAVKRLEEKPQKPHEPGIVSRIRGIGEFNEHTVAFLYGKAGRGKTYIASTFPKPILLLNIANEEGLKTLRNQKGIEVADVKTWNDFLELHAWLSKGSKYKTVVLDQITSLQTLGQEWLADKHRKDVEDLFGMWGKAWGELSGEIKTWLQAYRELREHYHVVFLAHERVFDTDENADSSDLTPSVGGSTMPSVASFVNGACDIVGQAFIRVLKSKDEHGKPIRKTQYCLRVGPHPNYITKIRRPPDAGPIPEFVVNPSYQKLVEIEAGEEIRTATKLKRRH